MKYFLLIIVSFLFKDQLICQVNWTVNTSIQLTPNVFQSNGSITVEQAKSRTPITIYGKIEFLIAEKKLLFNDGKNNFDLKLSELSSVNTDEYGSFPRSMLYTKPFYDSLLQQYRRAVYKKAILNEVTFSFSRRVEYVFEDGELKVRKQKYTRGKVCAVTPNMITILSEDGELSNFKDGEFNFLQIGEFRGLNCQSLYDYFLPIYKADLKKNVDAWEQKIKLNSVEQLLDKFGPVESISSINNENRIFTWRKKNEAFYIKINESTTTNTYVSSLFSAISPAFLRSYTYRSTSSFFSQQVGLTSVSSSKTTTIWNKDEGFTFAVMVDKDNRIVKVYHENLFTEATYGVPFEFLDL